MASTSPPLTEPFDPDPEPSPDRDGGLLVLDGREESESGPCTRTGRSLRKRRGWRAICQQSPHNGGVSTIKSDVISS